ncbi:hypothetical protein ABT224_19890 [Streptomyces sp. NPDC001584]|uniref:hypothetical protein n=1 Tax=Streptomyces sp. NPDC001584 TaxID=3154521 RepID=UPI00332E54C6
MTEINLTKDEYDAAARTLLESLGPEDSLTSRHIPAPGPVAPGITPLVVPDGYTLRETHRTHPDGSTELIREFVRDTAPGGSTPPPAPAAITTRRTLPDWLADNSRKAKAATYLAGAAAVTTVGAVYGDAIAAGITAGAGALWAATLTVLKVIGVAAGVGLLLRLTFGGGRRRRPRTGTFEGVVRGTWRQD